MPKHKSILWLIIAILVFVLGWGSGLCLEKTTNDQKTFRSLELFSNAISIVQDNYAKDVSTKDLIYGALSGMLSSLGPYSQFLTPDEYKDMKVQTEGKFGGLGIKVTIKDRILTIITPLHGTPADRAGLQAEDRIIKIDGKSTEGITLLDAVKKLRGKPGSQVKLTIFREKEGKIFDVTITRAIIKIESLKGGKIITGHIGYIKLVELQEDTPVEFRNAIVKLKQQKMDSLILDLRNDPGGLLSSAVEITDMLLDGKGVIVSTKGKSEKNCEVYKMRRKALIPDNIPVVVMVNGGSASGAEIIAGALQDYKRAVLLGTKTFGKGCVQTIIPLSDGSALRITTSKYYLPSGRCIHEKGIMPDVIVEQVTEKTNLENEPEKIFEKLKEKGKVETPEGINIKSDYQLQRAIDLIKGLNVYSKRYSKTAN